MKYEYLAVDQNGIKQKNIIEANSTKEVISFLQSKKMVPVHIKEQQPSMIEGLFVKKVKHTDVIFFTRQLASMIISGLTLMESLNILKKQINNLEMQKLIGDIIANVSEGKTFSESLLKHKEAFGEVYIALIKAAEKAGLLDKILIRLADNLEKNDDLKKKVKSALFYPLIIIIGVLLVIMVMNIFVIPQLATLYESMNLDLPGTTKIVLAFSGFVTNYYPIVFIMAISFVVGLKRFKKTEKGIRILDKVSLRLPVMGSIISLSVLDEISRTLSLLISSGTSIIEALNIIVNVANNYWYREAVKSSIGFVEKGVPLSKAFEQQVIFPPILVQMLKVGEATGKVDDSLLRMSEYFERDLDMQVKNLTTAIEPILIVVLGVTVAFLILSVITPIYSLISQIQ